jgi:hypothetical protein
VFAFIEWAGDGVEMMQHTKNEKFWGWFVKFGGL